MPGLQGHPVQPAPVVAQLTEHRETPMNFHQICEIAKLTPTERDDVAWFLAQFRAKKVYEELRLGPDTTPHGKLATNKGNAS